MTKRAVTIIVTWNVILLCIFGTFLWPLVLGGDTSSSAYSKLYGDGYNQLLSIPINGTILGSNTSSSDLGGLFSDTSNTYGYDVKDKLEAAAKDDLVKGVILEIDSPGGTIYGAHAITDAVKAYRDKTHKPIYAHISGTGASAAYWSAASTDKIFADYGSDVGSIGVIMGPFQYYDKVVAVDGGLLSGGIITQNGIEESYITAGRSKDIGNPYRKLTVDETKALQQSVNNEYDEFVNYVSTQRKIPADTIRTQLGALTYDTKTAKELKLTDETGSRQDAYKALAVAARVADDYSIVYEESSSDSTLDWLLGAIGRKPQPQAKSVDLCPLTKQALAYHGDTSSWCAKSD